MITNKNSFVKIRQKIYNYCMEKEPTFFGPQSYTEKEEEIAKKALGLWREKSRMPEAGEMEPTGEKRPARFFQRPQ